MPYISVQVLKGITRDEKRTIIAEFTETLVRVLGKNPDHIHIVIQEIEDVNWGFAGILTDEWRAAQPVGPQRNDAALRE